LLTAALCLTHIGRVTDVEDQVAGRRLEVIEPFEVEPRVAAR
jgi:hypothetical protein